MLPGLARSRACPAPSWPSRTPRGGLAALAAGDGRLLGCSCGSSRRCGDDRPGPSRQEYQLRRGPQPAAAPGLARIARFGHAGEGAHRDEPIAIRGARVHNLQGVDCDLPRNRLVVITGPSGSGKSSLAFDTLYAEGQRRYVESLSAYARQFLEQMEKPDVESVSGLSPAIAIEQRTTVSHPRSTVGTVTEIYDHLRVLFAALGRPHCPRCGEPIAAQTAEQMADASWRPPARRRVSVLAPVVRGRKGAFRKELDALRAARATAASASTAGAFDLDERAAARSPPQPPHRGAGGPAAPARRRPQKRLVAALEQRPAPGRRTWSWSSMRRRGAAATAGAWPARGATSRCPSCRRAPSPSTAPTARARPATAWAWRWHVDAAQGHAGRGAVAPRRRHPPLAAPRTAPGARGARGRRRAPRLLARRSPCARCRRPGAPGRCCRATARLPGRPAQPARPRGDALRWPVRPTGPSRDAARPSRTSGPT